MFKRTSSHIAEGFAKFLSGAICYDCNKSRKVWIFNGNTDRPLTMLLEGGCNATYVIEQSEQAIVCLQTQIHSLDCTGSPEKSNKPKNKSENRSHSDLLAQLATPSQSPQTA